MRGTEGAKSAANACCCEASAAGLLAAAGFGVAGRDSDCAPGRRAPDGEQAPDVADAEELGVGDLPGLWLPRNSIETLLVAGLAPAAAAVERELSRIENSASLGGPQQHRSACDFFSIHVRSHWSGIQCVSSRSNYEVARTLSGGRFTHRCSS